jgi:hypothetical protein
MLKIIIEDNYYLEIYKNNFYKFISRLKNEKTFIEEIIEQKIKYHILIIYNCKKMNFLSQNIS